MSFEKALGNVNVVDVAFTRRRFTSPTWFGKSLKT